MSENGKTSFETTYFAAFERDQNGVEVFAIYHTQPPEEFMRGRTHLPPLEKAEALSKYDSLIERAKRLSVTSENQLKYSGMSAAEFEESLANDYGGGDEGLKNARIIIDEIRSVSIALEILKPTTFIPEEEAPIIDEEKSIEQKRLEADQVRIGEAPKGGNFYIRGFVVESTGQKFLGVDHTHIDPTKEELWGSLEQFSAGAERLAEMNKRSRWYSDLLREGDSNDGPQWWSSSIPRTIGQKYWGLQIDPESLSWSNPDEKILLTASSDVTYKPYSESALPLDLESLEQPILPADVAKKINALLTLFETKHPACPNGLLIYGPPGTGKTITARYIAGCLKASFFDASTAALKKGYVGQSGQAVLELWTKVKNTKGISVIFIDECESVFVRRGGKSSSEITEELLNEFLSQWSGITPGKILVIGATNNREAIDPSALSRFGEKIELPAPDRAIRKKIITDIFKKKGIGDIIDKIDPDKLSEITQGKSGRELEGIASATAMNAASNGRTLPIAEDFYAATGAANVASSSAVDRSVSWDSLIIDQSLKDEIRNLSRFIANAEALAAKGFDVPRGMLLYGPPGTGKTLIAKVMAKESGVAFIEAKGSDLKGEYQGHTAPKIEALFADARRKAPCILFVDEIEASFPSRSGNTTEFSKEAVTTFLKETDGAAGRKGPPVFLLGATNHPDSIDEAVLSRIPNHVSVGLPGKEARLSMLNIFIGKLPHNLTEGDFDSIAEATKGKSGRDLHSLCVKAQQFAVADAGFDADRVLINSTHFKRILS